MAVMQIFEPSEKDARNLWLHAIQVAIVSQAMAHRLRMGNQEVAYLCGLMHDIGRFILFDVASMEVHQIDESGWQDPPQPIDV